MKTDKAIIALLRAIKAASPYASRIFQWEVGINPHLDDPFAMDEKIGGFDDITSWTHGIRDDVKVGTTVDFYIFRNVGCVAHPDWDLTTNYVVTITSPTTAIIRATCEPVRTFSL